MDRQWIAVDPTVCLSVSFRYVLSDQEHRELGGKWKTLTLRCPQKVLLILNALGCELIAGKDFCSCLTYKAWMCRCTQQQLHDERWCPEDWVCRTTEQPQCLRAGQPAFPELSVEPWPRTTGGSTELPHAPGRPARFAATWVPHLHQAPGEISVRLHSQSCGTFEKSRPVFSFCNLFSGPKGLRFFWFLSQPKEMRYRKHGPFPSNLLFRTKAMHGETLLVFPLM